MSPRSLPLAKNHSIISRCPSRDAHHSGVRPEPSSSVTSRILQQHLNNRHLAIVTTKWKGSVSSLSFKLTLMFGCTKSSLTTSTCQKWKQYDEESTGSSLGLCSWHRYLDGPSRARRLQTHDHSWLHHIIGIPQGRTFTNKGDERKEGRKRKREKEKEKEQNCRSWICPIFLPPPPLTGVEGNPTRSFHNQWL